MKYYQVEPFGTPVLDLIQACNSALVANLNRDGKQTPKPYEYKDFLLFIKDKKSEDSEIAVLDNGMTVSEFKTYIYMKALAERSQKA